MFPNLAYFSSHGAGKWLVFGRLACFAETAGKWLISTAVWLISTRVRGKCLILQRGAAGRIWLIFLPRGIYMTVEVTSSTDKQDEEGKVAVVDVGLHYYSTQPFLLRTTSAGGFTRRLPHARCEIYYY